MTVFCFGDSNTFGYDPCQYFGGRYDAENRWVDILAAETGWTFYNLGQNGREIPGTAPSFPGDPDLLILMLGTNDLLQGCSPQAAADKLERFLALLPMAPNQILLIAPPSLALGAWVANQQSIDDSKAFAWHCRMLAQRHGLRFADAGDWNIALAYDGVHFTKQGHQTFAARLLEVLA